MIKTYSYDRPDPERILDTLADHNLPRVAAMVYCVEGPFGGWPDEDGTVYEWHLHLRSEEEAMVWLLEQMAAVPVEQVHTGDLL